MDVPGVTRRASEAAHEPTELERRGARPGDETAQLWGWGRVPAPGYEVRGEDLERLTRDAVLSRGLGRSYGDSSLPPPGVRKVVGTALADRILAFDEDTGVLRAEAGLSLHALLEIFFQRGWFPPVTPGTRFVTLGGCVASDVHGKNHHCEGTFGQHVRSLLVRVAGGRVVECSPSLEPELFWATVGGMGLTGHILEVEVALRRIPSPWIWMESERVPDIDAYVERLDAAKDAWPMTMGWIDCLRRGPSMGRGILMRGRWATADEAPKRHPRPRPRLTMPFVLPGWLLNGVTMRLFNAAYYWRHWRRQTAAIVHPEPFFWPLDAILEWNRGYGPRGFTQYQCVLPRAAGPGAARRFLELLTTRGGASFLCVIKDCGPQGQGILSFPMPGISIALDIPVRDDTQALVDALNERVIEEGGRIYLTKDGFTRREHFEAMEPRLAEFQRIRRRWDPELTFRSAQSVRVLGDPAIGPTPAGR
jgi:decaprenylphospho-beta-D-ribofuranose 2-oxidase